MKNEEGSIYKSTVESLSKGITANQKYADEISAEVATAKKAIAALARKTRACPFCAGEMLGTTQLAKIDLVDFTRGNWDLNLFSPTYENGSGVRMLVPRHWECQKCLAFDIDAPKGKPDVTQFQGKASMTALLKKYFSNVTYAEPYRTNAESGWRVAFDDNTHWFLRGSKARLVQVLGLK